MKREVVEPARGAVKEFVVEPPRLLPVVDHMSRLYATTGAGGRLIPMEGIRGIAVLLVFFVHWYALFHDYVTGVEPIRLAFHFLGGVGNAGVDLFFVLSGYLIYGGLMRKKPDLWRFLFRRVQRIYPTFLVVLAGYLILSFIFPDAGRLKGRSLPAALAYVAENVLLLPGVFSIPPIITVAWSLSYEMFSYLAMAAIVLGGRMWTWRTRNRVLFFAGIYAVYFCLALNTQRSFVRALMFVVGVLLFEALESQEFRRKLTGRWETISIVLSVAALVLVYVMDRRPEWFAILPGAGSGWNIVPGLSAHHGPYRTLTLSIAAFFVVAHACGRQGRLASCFSRLPLRWLGNMSYSYYLVHGVTLQGVSLVLGRIVSPTGADAAVFLIALPIAFGVTWITSTVLFAAVEKPFSLASPRPHSVSKRATGSVA